MQMVRALLMLLLAVLLLCLPMETLERGFSELAPKIPPKIVAHTEHRISEDNCKSEKLREIILETIGLYPHQYSHQAR